MTRTPLLIAIAAAAALAGCNNEDHTITSGPADPMANLSNEDVKLPPAIVASRKYRCKDNSVIQIDWLSDGTANSARVTAGAATVSLAQTETGGAYTAEGASLTGDPQAPSVTYKGQSCKR